MLIGYVYLKKIGFCYWKFWLCSWLESIYAQPCKNYQVARIMRGIYNQKLPAVSQCERPKCRNSRIIICSNDTEQN